ncbi:MAG TPA: sigma-54-dependent Fis family transcriptional regulator [Planctomycetaceae bacterium]|nr:sigma-54-dependent Fis family transcriptional regulator [Planctomycetaceae bacterium]
MSRVLVIDDEPTICWGFQQLLSEEGHEVQVAASAEEGLRLAEQRAPDAIVLDVRLPGMDGLSAIELFRLRIGHVPIIVITAFGNLDTAVKALEQGAFDYLTKPFELEQISDVIGRALRHGRSRPGTPSQAAEELCSAGDESLVGKSQAMQRVFKQIALAARTDVSVLITGESGTGKELVAEAIHRHSSRRAGPFVPVCLAALSANVIESELFGHVRGAFTGADSDRKGLLELADGGTVFLDEIGDVAPAIQVKLLRAIERHEIMPVGDARPRRIDFRIIAATHQSLPELIASGRFREDLFYRLSVFQIELPPLRDRPEDIPLLAEHFLGQISGRAGPGGSSGQRSAAGVPDSSESAGTVPKRFSEAALRELMARPWYGNVRELRNAVEHAAVLSRTAEIGPESLPEPLAMSARGQKSCEQVCRRAAARWLVAAAEKRADGEPALYRRFLELVEPPLLEAALKLCAGNLAAAARLLGIHRATLRHKLRRYGIERPAER